MGKLISKIKESNQQISDPVKASFWYTVCSVVQKGIGLILVPVYVRLMSTEEYGVYTLFGSWEGIVLIFTTLNLAAYAFSNCLIKNEERKEWVTGAFLGLVSCLTAVVCVIFLVFMEQWEKLFGLSGKYVMALALDSSFVVVIDLWYAKKRFEYQYKGVVAVTLIISITNMAVGIAAVSASEDKAFAAIAVKLAVQGVVSLYVAVTVWAKSRCFFDKGLWTYALSFNIPLIPHFLSTRILQQADRIMIKNYCGLSQAGIYGFSYKISEAMLIFNSAFLGSLTPWTYKKLKDKKYDEIFGMAFGTLILIGAMNYVLILLAPEAVKILGTSEYYEAMYVIPPVACSCYLMYLFNVLVNVTYYYEKNKLVVLASIVAAVLNVGLNYIFIPRYGYLAAGYTTLASYICLVIMHGFMSSYTLRSVGVKAKVYDFRKITMLTAGLIVIGVSTTLLYDYNIIRYCIAAGLFIVAAANWRRIYGMLRRRK